MPDIYEYVGSDIGTSPTGDLQPVSGSLQGQQRILRRLMTNPGSYIFQPGYGAGLASYIGKTTTEPQLQGIVQRQMLLEPSVAQDPAPVVGVSFTTDGTFTVNITYTDAQTGTRLTLEFDVG